MSLSKKYGRTYHFTFSPGTTSDDRINHNYWNNFQTIDELVISEKLDGENCLSSETLLLTEFNGYKTIKWICENKFKGRVLTYDVFTNKEEFENILNHQILENNNDWYELELENEKTIILTSNHLVWIPKLSCYRKVENLKPGDDFLLKN